MCRLPTHGSVSLAIRGGIQATGPLDKRADRVFPLVGMPDQLRGKSTKKEKLLIERATRLLARLDFAEQLVHQRYMAWVRQHVLAFCLSTRGRPRQQVNNTALQCFGATFEEALAIRHVALLDLRYPAGREADQWSEFAQAEAAVFAPLSDISTRQRLDAVFITVFCRQGEKPKN